MMYRLRVPLLVIGSGLFMLSYALFFPVYVLGFWLLRDDRPLIRLTRWFAKLWLLGCGLRWKISYEVPLPAGRSFVMCANHNSYLDVPAIYTTGLELVFVGSYLYGRIPLFGYMYKRMHILLDRKSLRSRHAVMKEAKEALAAGRTLLFFPEGGRRSRHLPRLHSFLPGAFRTAIDAQVPIVPVTLMNTWMVWPKYVQKFAASSYKHMIEVRVHAPIETKDMEGSQEDVQALMGRVAQTIEAPLRATYPTHFAPTTSTQTGERY